MARPGPFYTGTSCLNTRKCVSSDIQTLRSRLKKRGAARFFLNGFEVFGYLFSNSLIIHQEKTKKITTVTVVWICDPNYHKILLTLALNFSKNY